MTDDVFEAFVVALGCRARDADGYGLELASRFAMLRLLPDPWEALVRTYPGEALGTRHGVLASRTADPDLLAGCDQIDAAARRVAEADRANRAHEAVLALALLRGHSDRAAAACAPPDAPVCRPRDAFAWLLLVSRSYAVEDVVRNDMALLLDTEDPWLMFVRCHPRAATTLYNRLGVHDQHPPEIRQARDHLMRALFRYVQEGGH